MNNKNTLQTIFIFGLFALLFVLILRMLMPFSSVILWTVLLYIIIKPLYERCYKKIDPTKKGYKIKCSSLAGVFAVATLIIIVLSLVVIGVLLVNQGIVLLAKAESFIVKNPDFFTSEFIVEKLQIISEKLNINLTGITIPSFEDEILTFIQSFSSKLLSFGKSFIGKTGSFAVSLVFIVFALYFCFLDGDYLVKLFKKAIPIKTKHMDELLQKFANTTKELFSGYILVALYQGVAAFLIFLCFGVDSALLLSVLLMFSTFIPMFGAAIVWMPMGIIMCVSESIVKGILFLLISGFCISFLDNFLRPYFLKDKIKLHPLVIFFAILGGIQVFGLNGLILGPIIIILFFTVLNLIVNTKEINNKSIVTEKEVVEDIEN